MEGIRGRPGFVSCALLAQGLATNPGHGLCSAPLAQAMPGAHPHLLAPLASAPARFLLAKAAVPLIISARLFFASLQACALLYCLAFTLQASACMRLRSWIRSGAQAWPLQCSARQGLAFISAKKSLALIPPPNHAPLSCALLAQGLAIAGREPHTSKHRQSGESWRGAQSTSLVLACFRTVLTRSARCGQSVRNGQYSGCKLGTVLTRSARCGQRLANSHIGAGTLLAIWPSARASRRSSACRARELQTL